MSDFNPFGKSRGKIDMYKGVTNMFGKPVEIKSKGHYQLLLKKHGMVDASPRECLQSRRKPESNARQQAKELTEKIYKKGAMPWVTLKEDPHGRDRR